MPSSLSKDVPSSPPNKRTRLEEPKANTSTTPVAPAPASAEPVPVLRGQYYLQFGYAIWSGRWGFDKSSFQSGDTSEFSFKSRGVNAAAVSLTDPVNGLYDGHFYFKTGERSRRKIDEKGLQLHFTKKEGTLFSVKGVGKNKFGTFDLSGEYDSSTKILEVTKVYTS